MPVFTIKGLFKCKTTYESLFPSWLNIPWLHLTACLDLSLLSDVLIRGVRGLTCRLDLVSTNTHTHPAITKINTLYPHITAFCQHVPPHQWAHPDSASKCAVPSDSSAAFHVSVWHQGGSVAPPGICGCLRCQGGHVATSRLPGFKAASFCVCWKMLIIFVCHLAAPEVGVCESACKWKYYKKSESL